MKDALDCKIIKLHEAPNLPDLLPTSRLPFIRLIVKNSIVQAETFLLRHGLYAPMTRLGLHSFKDS